VTFHEKLREQHGITSVTPTSEDTGCPKVEGNYRRQCGKGKTADPGSALRPAAFNVQFGDLSLMCITSWIPIIRE